MTNQFLIEQLKADVIVICGSGPSIRHFSGDRINSLGKVTYWALNNAFLYDRVHFDAVVSTDYTAISRNIKMLIQNPGIIKIFGKAPGPKECIIPDEYLIGENTIKYDVEDQIDTQLYPKADEFCTDITTQPLRYDKSIAITAIQIALYLRPKKIYLAGLDFDDSGHFDDENNDIEYKNRHNSWVKNHWKIDEVRNLWCEIHRFAEENYPETEIISVNPVKLRGIFSEVYMDCNVPCVTGYIGVKENSVRLPGKNMLPFGNSNLLINKIRQMKRCMNIEKIIVSTDSTKMLEMAEEEGVEGIRRPLEYANETKPYQEFIKYLTETLPGDHIMRCPVTAPLCDADILNDSISKYFWALDNGFDSLTSVLRFQHHMLDDKGPMNYTMDVNHKGSQNLPVWHEIANCMDIVPMDVMKRSLFQFGPKFYRYEVDKITALDIDDKMDYDIACAVFEYLIKRRDK